METKVIEESQILAWDNFVAQNPYGDVLQTWEWGEVKRSAVWEVVRIAAFDNDKIVGAAQILRRRLFKVFGLLYCPRGPVIDWGQENPLDVLRALVEFAKKEIAKSSDLFLRIEPVVEQIPNSKFQNPNKFQIPKSKFQNFGFLPYFKSIQPKHTTIVNLSYSEDEVIKNFEKDTRNSIHRAEREGVVVSKSEDLGDWQKFYELYQETSIRGHFAPRSWSQFEKIHHLMVPFRKAALYLSCFKDQVLATALILRNGSKAYYVWGASSRDQAKKFAPYLLQWEIMKDLKSQGISSYDLWGIAPDDRPGHAWAGHTLFKKGFRGTIVNYIGCLDLPLSPFYPLFRLIDYLRQCFAQPDLIG